MPMGLVWLGAELEAAAMESAVEVTRETTEKAAEYARTHHEWVSETGELEESIQAEAVEVKGPEVIGEWGSDSDHALWQEVGTHEMPARPYLRPAADATYHDHEERLAADFHGRAH